MVRVRLLLLSFLLCVPSPATAHRVDRAEHHEFVMENFRTESGAVLPKGWLAVLAGVVASRVVEDQRADGDDAGMTPGFNGDVERALRSIKVPFLYMPSETDLNFPIGDASYEAPFIPRVSFVPIPSLWGHPPAPARVRRIATS